MTRRIPTQYTEGPWPFLFSVVPERGGIVRNLGPKPMPPKERVRVDDEPPQPERVSVVANPFAAMLTAAPMHFRKGGTRWNRK